MKIIKKDSTSWYLIMAKSLRLFVLFAFYVSITGCTGTPKTSNESKGAFYTDEAELHADGTYCAEVEYYYSKTGTSSTYILSVEIEDNQLIRIDWPNGGWLDDTHFIPQNIEDDTAEFTSDEGVDYIVKIIGKEGDCSLSSNAIGEESLIDQANEAKYKEELDAHEEEKRIREEEEQERDRKEQERQTDELEQSEENVTHKLDKDILCGVFTSIERYL